MYRALVVLVVCLCLSSTKVFSQTNVISVDALGIGYDKFAVLRGAYERTLSPKISVLIGLEKGLYRVTDAGTLSSTSRVVDFKGWGITPQVRAYPFTKNKTSPLGFFVGAHYRFRRITEENYAYNITSKATMHDLGIHFGYKFTFEQMPFISFEILGGFGKASGSWDEPNDRAQLGNSYQQDLSDSSGAMRFALNIGFVFPSTKKQE